MSLFHLYLLCLLLGTAMKSQPGSISSVDTVDMGGQLLDLQMLLAAFATEVQY